MQMQQPLRVVDTTEYVSALRELVEQGHQVCMTIAGNSMAPFLVHHRDSIVFRSPDRPLRRGDIVFYRRDSGQYVCHRIVRVKQDGYYITGDGQMRIEGPVREDQIFARVVQVKRKGKTLNPGSPLWWFFETVWVRIIPLRIRILRGYTSLRCRFGGRGER